MPAGFPNEATTGIRARNTGGRPDKKEEGRHPVCARKKVGGKACKLFCSRRNAVGIVISSKRRIWLRSAARRSVESATVAMYKENGDIQS